MKIQLGTTVWKILAGGVLACGLIAAPVFARGGGHGGGHGGGGHHGGGHHAAGHHGGEHHGGAHHGGEHHAAHGGAGHHGPEHRGPEHHVDHHNDHHDQHHADHRNDHRDHRRDDHHVHYHYDHHHYYYGGGWGWLPDIWGWPGYVGPDYTNQTVNVATVNNTGDDTVESNNDVVPADLPSTSDENEQELPPIENRGIIRVKLPTPRAQVTYDGHPILGTRARRMIVTSPITGDKPVKYQVFATWMQNGERKHEVREGFISAGGNVLADFTKPAAENPSAAEDTTFTRAE